MYSIVIPAYNEEKNILNTLETYYRFFKKTAKKFEIIVVCDGCYDQTPNIVKEFKKDKPEIKLLLFNKRLGKGGGIIEGFKFAKGDIVGFTDADSSTSAEEFGKIIKELDYYDCAIGSRGLKESKFLKEQPIKRRVLGWFFRQYVNCLFGLGIKDTQCGAKIFKKSAIKDILSDMKITGFAFDVEILYRFKKMGYKIKEVGIKWTNQIDSKVKFRHIFEMFWSLLKLRFSI